MIEQKNTTAKEKTKIPEISVAPMMGWTDRHDRYFLRLITPNILLYTVMITTGALIHGDRDYFLNFNAEEHPVALQLGGSDPDELALCANYGEQAGYDEINLNCGCPSNKVQRGDFGACLMKKPQLVAQCVDEMKQKTTVPITVKCRIGVDDYDSYDFLTDFIGQSADKGCDRFIIHARKALLDGLSPKDNRTIPPLKWDIVYKLKQDFPNQTFILNGGVKTLDDIKTILPHTDGIMIGREAYKNPYLLSTIEREIFGTTELLTRHDVIDKLCLYIDKEQNNGVPLKDITRHILGLFTGLKGTKAWKRTLSDEAYKKGSNSDLVKKALTHISIDDI